MSDTIRSAFVSVVAAAATVGAYHVLLAPKPAPAPAFEDAAPAPRGGEGASALRREFENLRDEVRAFLASGTDGSEAARAAGALAARVEALEQRLVGGDPTARIVPSGVDSKPSQWTEAQIEGFRSLLETVEYRKAVERETKAYRQMVASVDPNLAPNELAAATSLLVDYLRAVRTVFLDPKVRDTPEDYAATVSRAKDLRAKLATDLKGVLRSETAEKVLERVPTFDPMEARSPASRAANAPEAPPASPGK